MFRVSSSEGNWERDAAYNLLILQNRGRWKHGGGKGIGNNNQNILYIHNPTPVDIHKTKLREVDFIVRALGDWFV